jgi:hypothetical protein
MLMRTVAMLALGLVIACRNNDLERISGSGPQVDYTVTVTDSRISGAGCVSSGQCTGHFVGYVDKRSDNGYVAAPGTPVYATLESDQQSSSVADTMATTDAGGNFVLDWTFTMPSGNLTFTFCGGPGPRDPDQGCARIVFRG